MVGREVQRVEVELLALHLRALGQLPTHRDEGVRHVLGQDGDRVAGPQRRPGGRQGDVDGLGHQDRRVPLGAQHRQPVVIGRLRRAAGHIDPLAGIGALISGQSAQGLTGQRDRRAIPQILGLGPGQRLKVAGCPERPARGVDGGGQGVLRQQIEWCLTHAATLSFAIQGPYAS